MKTSSHHLETCFGHAQARAHPRQYRHVSLSLNQHNGFQQKVKHTGKRFGARITKYIVCVAVRCFHADFTRRTRQSSDTVTVTDNVIYSIHAEEGLCYVFVLFVHVMQGITRSERILLRYLLLLNLLDNFFYLYCKMLLVNNVDTDF